MRGCSTCKYYSNTCGRYLINPELLKDPKECGKSETGYPHWDIRITNELKEKVFAQYLGQRIFWQDIVGELTAYNLHGASRTIEVSKLILKPLSLSTIELEDKLWIADLFGWEEVKNIQVGAFLEEIKKTEYNSYPADKTIIAYQYLISKGYDMPSYLLGGKTLHECGLAIYGQD